ncbi:hypothetical protein KIPB_015620, partial [Kipferlia bialata]
VQGEADLKAAKRKALDTLDPLVYMLARAREPPIKDASAQCQDVVTAVAEANKDYRMLMHVHYRDADGQGMMRDLSRLVGAADKETVFKYVP